MSTLPNEVVFSGFSKAAEILITADGTQLLASNRGYGPHVYTHVYTLVYIHVSTHVYTHVFSGPKVDPAATSLQRLRPNKL